MTRIREEEEDCSYLWPINVFHYRRNQWRQCYSSTYISD